MDKMWAGRFKKETDSKVNAFNSSIDFDQRMYFEDIKGSIFHAEMLSEEKIISENDSKAIIDGLYSILDDIDNNDEFEIDTESEDIHMFIEAELTKRIGRAGKRLHTARSRNDQVTTDLRMYLKRKTNTTRKRLISLIGTLCRKSLRYTRAIMPGYTHLQRAQPITFAHHLMAYANMFMRDIDRIDDAVNRMMSECPLGSCALAGTTYPIDREMTAIKLGFDKPCANSLDGVSDRDFCIEIASALSIIMVHLSRFSEEIILWCSWEFKFIELDDAFATGSSIMPQKKNPDVAELVRGKSARVFGDLQTLLVTMKGLPLAYNKDMQEDKEAIFDAVDTVNLCLRTFTPMIWSMDVKDENMRNAAAKGFINATDCADYLVKKGMAFRDAYKITGELVAYCIEEGYILEDLPIEIYRKKSRLFNDDVRVAVNLDTCLKKRSSYGGPAPECVTKQIINIKEKLRIIRNELHD